MKRVLVLCTGNSCRSQMAEALINKLGKDYFHTVSAGAKPSGYVHPLSLKIIKDEGIPTEGLRSKSWDEFKSQKFDFVITVCDNANQTCPIWPGQPNMIHWSIADPGEALGTEEEKLVHFRATFNDLKQRIGQFLAANGK